MGWQEERDRLLADTLAFVQSLAVETPQAAPARAARRLTDADLHEQMQARLAAFRNRQRFLQIEREAHYALAMQRIHAVTEQWA